ncbi:MAG: TetR/AcrR family transcriptional regulator [Fimbriimonadaceae bacterium]|nr:TetR/AcrR family transcriptional regulator [Fimbriimonadaceae bacterium]
MSGEELSTRERLIETARDLFLLQGYHTTGVAEIVRTAGVKTGSLYYFFPTKEDLLLAVLEWYRDNIYAGLLQPVYERIDDPIERIFGVLDGYRQMLLLTAYDQGCPIGNLSLELTNSHPKARELINVNFDQWASEVRSCLDRAEGRLPAELDRQGLAEHILAVMEGAIMLARSYRSIEPYDKAILHLRDYLDRLVADGTEWSTPGRYRRANQMETEKTP